MSSAAEGRTARIGAHAGTHAEVLLAAEAYGDASRKLRQAVQVDPSERNAALCARAVALAEVQRLERQRDRLRS